MSVQEKKVDQERNQQRNSLNDQNNDLVQLMLQLNPMRWIKSFLVFLNRNILTVTVKEQ